MKYNFLCLLFHLLYFSPCLSQDKNTPDTAAINSVFKNYTDAIQKGQGKKAIKYISRKTLDYYDTLIFHALYSDEKKLNKINILTRTAILRMRHTQPVTYWDTMTARKLMEQMWSNSPPDQTNTQVSLANCKIDHFTAICALELNDELTEMKFLFNKENDEWKIDITSINEIGVEEMQKDIKRRNISETDYIILTLENLENIKVSKEKLYVPLKKR